MRNTGLNYFLISLFVCFMLFSSRPALAHHLLPTHELNCSSDFPCPAELQRRIDFWIQVFKGWSRAKAVFHDPDSPEKVYSVLETGEGCSRRVYKVIKKERNRIKTMLYNVARKLESESELSSEEKHFALLFPNSKPSMLRSASENIRCQSGVRDNYIAGLKRFSRYSYMVDTVLAQHQLPPDIRYLPFVESSYDPGAYSKAGAAGMWQIMPKTARVLGLELNATIDERLDPEAATQAAARYLVDARRSLTRLSRSIDPGIKDQEINPFIITSYNYGVNGMRKAIRTVKPDYHSVIEQYKSPAFQVAVKNFYSSFLAARHVTLNADQYFDDFNLAKPLEYQTLVLQHPTSVERISRIFNVLEEDLKPVNLGLTRFAWNGWRMIPAGYQLKLPGENHRYTREIAALNALPPETAASVPENYIVRKGDTACGIARALQVNCTELIRMNQLGRRALIRVGQKLEIPRRFIVVTEPAVRGMKKNIVKRESNTAKPFSYRVKRGDTACGIASKNDVECRQLIAVNNLGRKATIYVGQRLVIPGRFTSSGQIAGLDENNKYLVRKGDFACTIARNFNVSCKALKKLNQLNKKATIYPGQRLKIPGLEVPDTTETVENLAQVEEVIKQAEQQSVAGQVQISRSPGLSNLLDTLPNLRISVTDFAGSPVYRIWVEADETLGHYADWLGMRSSKQIRQLNNLTKSRLRIGQSLKLPIDSGGNPDSVVEKFENKRMEYHQVLNEELKVHYMLSGVEKYVVQSGDSIWSLSKQRGFPIWLFYRLNPALKAIPLNAKQTVLLPDLQKK